MDSLLHSENMTLHHVCCSRLIQIGQILNQLNREYESTCLLELDEESSAGRIAVSTRSTLK
jgi:hypothetical protein